MADTEEIRDLLDQGLTHYGLGEVGKALGAWKRVLELEPDNTRAMEYIRFVEENWAPNQDREQDSYRPDEGTDPKAKAEAEAEAQAAVPAQPAGRAALDRPADRPAPDAEDFVPPVRSEVGQWGDLYDFDRVGKDITPAPASPAAAAPAVAPAPVDPPPAVDLPPGSEGDDGFSAWSSEGWSSAPDSDGAAAARPDLQVEQIESSTLPARPDPTPAPLSADARPESKPLPDLPAQAATAAAAPPAAGPAGADGAADTASATDGWQTLGAPVKTDPELRIDPALQSAFSRLPSEPEKLVIQPTPPFSDSQPPPAEPAAQIAFDPDPDDQQPAPGSEPVSISEPPQQPALTLESFSLDSTPPPAGPSALGLVGGGAMPMEDEGSGDFDSVTALMSGVNDMLELDDFSGAVELLDKVLEQDPDHAEATRLREDAERELIKMFESKLGDMDKVPEVRMASDEIIWLNLDHRAGFLLSMIDGQISYDDILAVSGLPRLDVLRILAQLLQEKVIDVS